MSPLQGIDIELEGLGHILSDNKLAVPAYQRSYAWEDRHVLDLFQDLGNAITQDEAEYFLGSIVIIENEDGPRPEVVDGQQRLATTSILLAAIRDYFFVKAEQERADDVERDYLITRNRRTQERVAKLQLNEGDQDFFMKRILSPPDSPDRQAENARISSNDLTRESHKRLLRAAELAKSHVNQLANLTSRPADFLMDWADYLDDRARAIKVTVPDHANAFTIFETLNDRGLNLAITDLLKNYLFGLAGERIAEAQERWVRMLGILDTVDGEEIAVEYIRHFWSSRYGLTREKDLYEAIRAKITSKQLAINFATELADEARNYAALINVDKESWKEYGATAREHMATINLLRMVQIRPLLLAVIKKFPPQEVQTSLKIMVSWGVRFLISGGVGGGTLETYYSDRAREVRNDDIQNTRELVDAMRRVVPSDTRFKEQFATANVSRNYLARYYLRVLENQERGEAEPELIPNPNEEIVNLEHVMPQNPSDKWSEIDEETHKGYYKRIGNLALMSSSENSNAGNEDFDTKKQLYITSDFELTSQINEYQSWGPQQIAERQERLAELAVSAWRPEL